MRSSWLYDVRKCFQRESEQFTRADAVALVMAQASAAASRKTMKRKGVGVLLSALVFPGVGQLYLGRRGRGLLFLVLAAVAGFIYAGFALDQANALAGQVMSGSVPLDPIAMAAKLDAMPTPWSVTLAGAVFVVCWLGSVLEAWLVRGA
jgi:hypothetical protein